MGSKTTRLPVRATFAAMRFAKATPMSAGFCTRRCIITTKSRRFPRAKSLSAGWSSAKSGARSRRERSRAAQVRWARQAFRCRKSERKHRTCGAFLHPPPAEGIPEWRGGGACQLRTRCCQSVSQRAHAFPFCVYRTRSTPECRGRKTCHSRTRRYTRLIGRWDCQPRTRRWKPFCQRTNALLFSARRTNYLRVPCAYLLRRAYRTRLVEQRSPLVLHAALPVSLPESTCSHIPCFPGLLSIHKVPTAHTCSPHCPIPYPSEGVWGLCPHD